MPKTMKIVHITPRYFPNIGGVETLVKEICESLIARGLDISVYSLDKSSRNCNEEIINGVVVKRYRALIGDPLFLPPLSFLKDLRNEKSAILHVHNLQNIFPLFVSLAKNSNQLLVFQPHYHRYGQTPYRHFLLTLYKTVIPKLVINRSQLVIANSPYEEKILKSDFSPTTTILTLPEGLPLKELEAIPRNPESPDRILYVGTLKRYKKVDAIISALKILLESQEDPLTLVIVGDGPERQRLAKLADKLGVSNHIEWKMNLSNQLLLQEYSKARVFVLLSLFESFSRVVNEAVIMGIPTVVPKNGVFSDLVRLGVAEGVLSENPEEIAKAISRARTEHYKSIDRKHFSLNDMDYYVDCFATIYRSLINKFG